MKKQSQKRVVTEEHIRKENKWKNIIATENVNSVLPCRLTRIQKKFWSIKKKIKEACMKQMVLKKVR